MVSSEPSDGVPWIPSPQRVCMEETAAKTWRNLTVFHTLLCAIVPFRPNVLTSAAAREHRSALVIQQETD